MTVLVLTDQFQRRSQNVCIITTHASYEPVSVTCLHHLGCEIGATLQQASSIGQGGAFALTTLEKGIGIDGFPSLIVARVVAFVVEMKADFLNHSVDAVNGPQENRETDSLLGKLCGCPQHSFIIAFWEDNPLSFALDLIDNLSHD